MFYIKNALMRNSTYNLMSQHNSKMYMIKIFGNLMPETSKKPVLFLHFLDDIYCTGKFFFIKDIFVQNSIKSLEYNEKM